MPDLWAKWTCNYCGCGKTGHTTSKYGFLGRKCCGHRCVRGKYRTDKFYATQIRNSNTYSLTITSCSQDAYDLMPQSMQKYIDKKTIVEQEEEHEPEEKEEVLVENENNCAESSQQNSSDREIMPCNNILLRNRCIENQVTCSESDIDMLDENGDFIDVGGSDNNHNHNKSKANSSQVYTR
eukprot:UN06126